MNKMEFRANMDTHQGLMLTLEDPQRRRMKLTKWSKTYWQLSREKERDVKPELATTVVNRATWHKTVGTTQEVKVLKAAGKAVLVKVTLGKVKLKEVEKVKVGQKAAVGLAAAIILPQTIQKAGA